MTRRKKLTKLQRVRIFDENRGECHLCGLKIKVGEKWDADHIIPLWRGGEDGESYMAPAHIHCHADKSAADAPVKAKTDRVRAKHLGIKKRSSFSGWQKMDGTPKRNPHYGKPQP
jgi:5-methylcytosine-specific restriction protein A